MTGQGYHAIDRLAALWLRGETPDEPTAAVLENARTQAVELMPGPDGDEYDQKVALVFFTTRLAAGLWPTRRFTPAEVTELLDASAEIAGAPRKPFAAMVASGVLREPALPAFPAHAAVDLILEMLAAFAPVQDLTLWVRSPKGTPEVHWTRGDRGTGSHRRNVARAVLAGQTRPAGARVIGVPVAATGRPSAAIVFAAKGSNRARAGILAGAAATVLSPLLERQALVAETEERQRSLVELGERRLVQIGLDLHDDALQDLAALAGELRHFRGQLAGAASDTRLTGRVDDIEARLLALDHRLRGLCNSLEAGRAGMRSLGELLRAETGRFAERGDAKISLSVSGDVSTITGETASAVARIVQESLSNVSDHAEASSVSVEVHRTAGQLRLSITDDGCGFEIESELVAAARRGRLGLVGLHERARMLGGTCRVASSPGHGTTVAIQLPLAAEPQAVPDEPAVPALRVA